MNVGPRLSRAARVKITLAERRLLELLFFDAELRDLILPTLEVSDYESLATGELFASIIAIRNEGRQILPETLMEHLGDDETSLDLAHELLQVNPGREPGEAIDEVLAQAEDCVFALRSMAIANRITDVSREAAVADGVCLAE